jgi:hypothetical protein
MKIDNFFAELKRRKVSTPSELFFDVKFEQLGRF